MVKVDIILKKGKCQFCLSIIDLWGIEVVVPLPDLQIKELKVFICECCLRNQIGKIQDRSYMENGIYR